MRIFLLTTVIIVWSFILWQWKYNADNTPKLPAVPEVAPQEIGEHSTAPKVDPVFEKINEDNNKIKTFICENVELKLSQKGKSFGLTGTLYYEKERNFRLKLNSFRGPELDLGSNDTHFWFWSRSMQPSALYYARHGYVDKTRLREPFNPVWIMQSLGIEVVDLESKVAKIGNKTYITTDVKSAQGKELLRSQIIEDGKITGYYLFSKENQFITITQITRDSYGMPEKILTSWAEENVSMEFRFGNTSINKIPARETFVMPNYREKIDMENY